MPSTGLTLTMTIHVFQDKKLLLCMTGVQLRCDQYKVIVSNIESASDSSFIISEPFTLIKIIVDSKNVCVSRLYLVIFTILEIEMGRF